MRAVGLPRKYADKEDHADRPEAPADPDSPELAPLRLEQNLWGWDVPLLL
jgi:hypothetical protein